MPPSAPAQTNLQSTHCRVRVPVCHGSAGVRVQGGEVPRGPVLPMGRRKTKCVAKLIHNKGTIQSKALAGFPRCPRCSSNRELLPATPRATQGWAIGS